MSAVEEFSIFVQSLTTKRWIRFGITGGIATLCYALLGLFFVNVLGMYALVGNALAYVLSFVVSYLGQTLWTFQINAEKCIHFTKLPRFAAAQALGLTLNTLLIWLLMALCQSYRIAMAAAALLVPAVVYLLCKYWVFQESPSPPKKTR